MTPLPALRHLDATPVEHEGQEVLCLSDPEGIVTEQAVLSPMAFFVAACLDGSRDVVGIQEEFARQSGGQMLMSADIERVVDFLDEHGFLQNERYLAMRRAKAEAFARKRVRPACIAGRSYPAERDALNGYLEKLFAGVTGDCFAALAMTQGGERARIRGSGDGPLACLIVPHIDFERGGAVYAQGYGRLRCHEKPDTVLVFGVAHRGGATPFMLTRKTFATPLGPVRNDTEVTDALAAACRWDAYEDELVHETEHSIEFQALMVRYLFGAHVKMAPVLCGNLGGELGDAHPADSADIQAFLDACRAVVSAPGRRITVIAGADLAHVGPCFGDPFEITQPVLDAMERRDGEDLALAAALDADGFYRSVMRDGNARHVCGLGCIYAALKSAQGIAAPGERLAYGHAPDPTGGVVSFAGIAFPRKDNG